MNRTLRPCHISEIRYAAQAITAMRAGDGAALCQVLDTVNEDRAGPQFVGAAVDLYAKLLPVLCTAEGQEFLSTWTARIIGLEDQYN